MMERFESGISFPQQAERKGGSGDSVLLICGVWPEAQFGVSAWPDIVLHTKGSGTASAYFWGGSIEKSGPFL